MRSSEVTGRHENVIQKFNKFPNKPNLSSHLCDLGQDSFDERSAISALSNIIGLLELRLSFFFWGHSNILSLSSLRLFLCVTLCSDMYCVHATSKIFRPSIVCMESKQDSSIPKCLFDLIQFFAVLRQYFGAKKFGLWYARMNILFWQMKWWQTNKLIQFFETFNYYC